LGAAVTSLKAVGICYNVYRLIEQKATPSVLNVIPYSWIELSLH
jgi:hypothetical protein